MAITEKTRIKMSISAKRRIALLPHTLPNNKGLIRSEETKEKISKAKKGQLSPMKGKKHTEETKEKISINRRGIKPSKETRLKMSLANRGEKCHLWRGGISKGYKEEYGSLKYKLWRESVFKRDNYTCKCGFKGNQGYITAHHIKSWAKYPKLRFDINNGQTLCEECHKLTDNYKGKGNKK